MKDIHTLSLVMSACNLWCYITNSTTNGHSLRAAVSESVSRWGDVFFKTLKLINRLPGFSHGREKLEQKLFTFTERPLKKCCLLQYVDSTLQQTHLQAAATVPASSVVSPGPRSPACTLLCLTTWGSEAAGGHSSKQRGEILCFTNASAHPQIILCACYKSRCEHVLAVYGVVV